MTSLNKKDEEKFLPPIQTPKNQEKLADFTLSAAGAAAAAELI